MRYLLAAMFVLAACGGGGAPRVKYYDLTSAAPPTFCHAPNGPVVALEYMNASAGFDSSEIAIRSLSGAIENYLYHRWAAPIPRLVNELVAEVFAKSGNFRRVDIDVFAADADLVVRGRILRLEGVRRPSDATIARVVIVVSAREKGSDAPLMVQHYSRDVPVSVHSVDGLVGALREAVLSIANEAADDLSLAAVGDSSAALQRPSCRNPTTQLPAASPDPARS